MRTRRILAAVLAVCLTATACGGGASRSAVILSGATIDTGATFEPDPKTDYPRKPTPPTHAAS